MAPASYLCWPISASESAHQERIDDRRGMIEVESEKPVFSEGIMLLDVCPHRPSISSTEGGRRAFSLCIAVTKPPSNKLACFPAPPRTARRSPTTRGPGKPECLNQGRMAGPQLRVLGSHRIRNAETVIDTLVPGAAVDPMST